MRRWVAEEEENKKKKGRCRSTPAYRPRGSQKGKIENLFLALSMDVDLFIEESATTPRKKKKEKKIHASDLFREQIGGRRPEPEL